MSDLKVKLDIEIGNKEEFENSIRESVRKVLNEEIKLANTFILNCPTVNCVDVDSFAEQLKNALNNKINKNFTL